MGSQQAFSRIPNLAGLEDEDWVNLYHAYGDGWFAFPVILKRAKPVASPYLSLSLRCSALDSCRGLNIPD